MYVYLGALIATLLVTPGVIQRAGQIGAVDRPGLRTVHDRPIPGIGGVAIFLSTLSAIILVLFLCHNAREAFRVVRVPSVALLGAATLVFGLGLADDLKELSAGVKFLAELLVSVLLCVAGVRISRIALTDTWILSLDGGSYLLTSLWIVGITNAINLSDGLDGLAAGICSIACAVIALMAFCRDVPIAGLFMLALLGSLCGFLLFNFHPAKIFMGDCGSLFAGFLIAASSVLCLTQSGTWTVLAVPALVLAIPIFDTLFSMLRRFLDRRSLFAPDRSHLHHRLLDLGWSHRRVVLTLYLITFLAAGVGVWLSARADCYSLVALLGVVLLIVLVFRAAGVIDPQEVVVRLRWRYARLRHERDERRVFEDCQLQFRQAQDEDQWWQAVCQTAARMDFAWMFLRTAYQDGRIEEKPWGVPRTQPDMSRILTIAIPLGNGGGPAGVSCLLEVAIRANNSVESAGRRAALFGRLMDENGTRPKTQDPTPEHHGCSG